MNQQTLSILIKAQDIASVAINKAKESVDKLEQKLDSVSNKGFKNFENAARQTADYLKGAFVTGITVAGTALIGLGTLGVQAANQFEKGQLKYETILGSQEKALQRINELQVFAAKTPFELDEIVSADTILQNFGIRTEKNLNIIGDAAAITDTQFKDLSLIFGQLSQSKGMDNIRQLMERGVVSINELKTAGIEFAKDGSVVNSVEDTYNKILNVVEKKFAGGMDKLSSTLEGRISTLKDTLGGKLREFVTDSGVFEVIKNLTTQLTDFLSKIDVKGVLNTLKDAFEQARPTLENFKNLAWFIATQVWPMLTYAFEQTKGPLTDLWNSINELVLLLSPVLLPALQFVWAFLVQTFVGIVQVVSGALKVVTGIIKMAVGLIVGIFTGDFSMVKEGAKQVLDGLIQIIKGQARIMFAPIMGAVDGIKNFFKGVDLFSTGNNIIQSLGRGIDSALSTIRAKVKNIANYIPQWLRDTLGIRSPSRVTMEIGEFTGLGIAKGLINSLPKVEQTVNQYTRAVTDPFSDNKPAGAALTVEDSQDKQIIITFNIQGKDWEDENDIRSWCRKNLRIIKQELGIK